MIEGGSSASSTLLPTFRFLVPPPAGYFPAMESNQRSPGLRARTRGRGAAVEITGPASPLVGTRRFSLRPQHFGRTVRPLGRISPLQDLVIVSLAGLVHMPPFGLPSSTGWICVESVRKETYRLMFLQIVPLSRKSESKENNTQPTQPQGRHAIACTIVGRHFYKVKAAQLLSVFASRILARGAALCGRSIEGGG